MCLDMGAAVSLTLLVCARLFFFLMIRRPPRSTLDRSSAASDVYKRQEHAASHAGVETHADEVRAELGFAGGHPQIAGHRGCLLYTSPSPRDRTRYRMPSSA